MQGLTERQRELVATWLPGARVVHDHAWGLLEGAVLEVETDGGRFAVKAGGPANHHIGREITAHETMTAPLVALGLAPRLVAADREANLLATEWLEGELVLDTAAASEPDTWRQAGELLRLLHGQDARTDVAWGARRIESALAALDRPHRIAPADADAARRILERWTPRPVVVVPTHGDWQPRNWLLSDGELRIIDFGRADRRPAMSDLTRVAGSDWTRHPGLEKAFLDGYGDDPRDPDAWEILLLCEAISTAVWALQVGDEAFEREGLRLIAASLARARG